MSHVETASMRGSLHKTWAKTEGQTPKCQLRPDGAAKRGHTATYDAAGNPIGIQELDGSLVTLGYDADGWLTLEQRSGADAYDVSYSYDAVGNRSLKGDTGAFTGYSCDAANELCLISPPSGPVTTVLYDSNGSRTAENAAGQITTFGWDYEGRLVKAAYPDGTVDTMTYAADGQRRGKQTADGTVGYVWDGPNVLLETDEDGATQAHYTEYPGEWGGLTAQRRDETSTYYGADPAEAIRLLLDASAAVTDRYLYSAFGEELLVSGPTVNPYRYGGRTGYYRDRPNRLHARARELDPPDGIWYSRDPPGFSGGDWNLYRYVANNPLALLDPSGLDDTTILGQLGHWDTWREGLETSGGALGSALTLNIWQPGDDFRARLGYQASNISWNVAIAALTAAWGAAEFSAKGAISYNTPGRGALGETGDYGARLIKEGLRPDVLEETLRHELVHSVLSAGDSNAINVLRSDIGVGAYWRFPALKVTEEFLAELNATRSIPRAWLLALDYLEPGEGALALREAILYVASVSGAATAGFLVSRRRCGCP